MDTIKKILRWALVAGIVVLLAFGSFALFANFSTGYRAGVPIKVSKKGRLIKTYEGELNIGGLTSTESGAIPQTWEFSIRRGNTEVLEKLDEAIENNKRVKVLYHEKFFKLSWLGDTKYFAYDVEILE